MELIQALQTAAFWYCTVRHVGPLAIARLMQMAADMFQDLGISDPYEHGRLGATETQVQVAAPDAWRTRLAGYLFSANMGICMRIPFLFPWTDGHEMSLFPLEYFKSSMISDRLFCQLIRVLRVCEHISAKARLKDFDFVVDVAGPETQLTILGLQSTITDWKAQIPRSVDCPLLKIWEHYAMLLVHESVLHTTSNKRSFAAPYITERLSLTDYPVTKVTPEQATSIHALRDNSQALLYIFQMLDLSTIMSFPPTFIQHSSSHKRATPSGSPSSSTSPPPHQEIHTGLALTREAFKLIDTWMR